MISERLASYRLGIDVGGTFTDIVLLEDTSGEISTRKVLTTPRDPWLGVRQGVRALAASGLELGLVKEIIHGTTLVSNALIERRGARVGLITTQGFRDLLYLRREFRYDIYDRDMIFPDPLVPRHLRREVAERVAGDGSVLIPLDQDMARPVVRELLTNGVEAIAVCLMNSYQFPGHEIALRKVIEAETRDVPVSLSHEVLPQIREYERCSATTINAYVQPIVGRYLRQLRDGLRSEGCGGELYLMTSSGGTMTIETAEAFPIQAVESGPVAGALIAALLGRLADRPNVLSFDMGGTTAKSCVIRHGRPLIAKSPEVARVQRFKKGSGLPLGIPVVDLIEIGAGGGSIAEIDAVGLLRVGPRSASADPGPACYGRGGTEPTVTDANLVLGLMNAHSFLAGGMQLDLDAALRAVDRGVGRRLGLGVEEAASAIHQVVTENMAEAARVHATEVNVDVRGFAMTAFGGAGPLHACEIAERLGLPLVICPREAGVLSAVGLLAAPLAFEFSTSLARDLESLNVDEANRLLESLTQRGRNLLLGAGVREMRLEYSVDMCYVGQRYEVTTPIELIPLTTDRLDQLKTQFDKTYEEVYGRSLVGLAARCVTWRVQATGPAPSLLLRTSGAAVRNQPREAVRAAQTAERRVVFPMHGVFNSEVYSAERLIPGMRGVGPAIIEEQSSTVVVTPGAKFEVDAWGNVVIRLPRKPAGRQTERAIVNR